MNRYVAVCSIVSVMALSIYFFLNNGPTLLSSWLAGNQFVCEILEPLPAEVEADREFTVPCRITNLTGTTILIKDICGVGVESRDLPSTLSPYERRDFQLVVFTVGVNGPQEFSCRVRQCGTADVYSDLLVETSVQAEMIYRSKFIGYVMPSQDAKVSVILDNIPYPSLDRVECLKGNEITIDRVDDRTAKANIPLTVGLNDLTKSGSVTFDLFFSSGDIRHLRVDARYELIPQP